MMGALMMMAALAPVSAHLTDRAEVAVGDRSVRLGDVAAVIGGSAAEREQLSRGVLARLPLGRQQMVVSRAALADLVRRNAGLRVSGEPAGTLTIRFNPPEAAPQLGGCWAASERIVSGSLIRRDQVVEAPCEPKAGLARVRFDVGSKAVRAAADIEPGTALGRLALPPEAVIEQGDRLALTSSSGPVTISRPVTALQPGRSGRRIFVRDADGAVLSVPAAPTPQVSQ